MNSLTRALASAMTLCCVAVASAHDLWVQTNTPVVRVGDSVIVDVMLGNHGNEHRDFKLAGKADPASITLSLVDPAGKVTDLAPKLADIGLGSKEGYLSGRALAAAPGFYSLILTSDKVVSYAPTRSIKSAKTFFTAAKRLDQPLPTQGRLINLQVTRLKSLPLRTPSRWRRLARRSWCACSGKASPHQGSASRSSPVA